jgi:hypothetical protein
VYGVNSNNGTAIYGQSLGGTGVYGRQNGGSNTGYAVYGINNAITNNAINYGGYFETTSTVAAYGVEGVESGAGNTGYAGYFSNTAISGTNFGVEGTAASTGTGTGVYGGETGASNTGYAGYFTNSSATGWTVYAAGTAPNYFAGNVSIGTTANSYTLQVNGSVAGTQAYVNASDARLKKNIKTLEHGLDTVEKLRGVRFDWRTPEEREVGQSLNLPADQPQVGFIAQEVEKVLPEAVVISKDGIRSMEESKMTPVLVEAVKELKADNDDLRKKLEAVENHKGGSGASSGTELTGSIYPRIMMAFGVFGLLMLGGMGGLTFMLLRTQKELRKLARRR